MKSARTPRRFSRALLDAVQRAQVIGIRAGAGGHRIIGIWAVVVDGRVFVRSWSRKPDGWHDTLVREPRGTVEIGGRTVAVRAVQTRSDRLKDAVSRAHREKYCTPGALKYVRDMARPKSRATTTELIPLK